MDLVAEFLLRIHLPSQQLHLQPFLSGLLHCCARWELQKHSLMMHESLARPRDRAQAPFQIDPPNLAEQLHFPQTFAADLDVETGIAIRLLLVALEPSQSERLAMVADSLWPDLFVDSSCLLFGSELEQNARWPVQVVVVLGSHSVSDHSLYLQSDLDRSGLVNLCAAGLGHLRTPDLKPVEHTNSVWRE